MKSELSMGTKRITNLASPRFDYDAANAKYVEDNYVQLSGASNDLSMNNHKITNLGLPMSDNDVVGKQYLKNINTNSMIFGTINSSGYFVVNNAFILCLKKVYIMNIQLRKSKPKYNMADNLVINTGGLAAILGYQFTYPAGEDIIVNIDIMRYFEVIRRFQVSIYKNVTYLITLKTLNI